MTVPSLSERIKVLNDSFRQTLLGGKVVFTAGVAALDGNVRAEILGKVRSFDSFSGDNDPHGEHDFGSFVTGGEKFFWKIDYYDINLEFGSEEPADPKQTTRVLTIMLAEEY